MTLSPWSSSCKSSISPGSFPQISVAPRRDHFQYPVVLRKFTIVVFGMGKEIEEVPTRTKVSMSSTAAIAGLGFDLCCWLAMLLAPILTNSARLSSIAG